MSTNKRNSDRSERLTTTSDLSDRRSEQRACNFLQTSVSLWCGYEAVVAARRIYASDIEVLRDRDSDDGRDASGAAVSRNLWRLGSRGDHLAAAGGARRCATP